MSAKKYDKLNHLLQTIPKDVVLQSSWLVKKGYSLDLQKRYKKSNWFYSIGNGALIRKGDNPTYLGAIFALQQQSDLSIHIGGRSAFALIGNAHYLDIGSSDLVLIGNISENLPRWFKNFDWGFKINYYRTSFLPDNLGLVDFEAKNFTIKISSSARAILEALYLAPKKQDLFECYELMENLNNLRPDKVQELLENCSSIKVKRLFLYLAEKCEHEWLRFIDISKINLGTGKYSLVKNGYYIDKYQITVPREFKDDE